LQGSGFSTKQAGAKQLASDADFYPVKEVSE